MTELQLAAQDALRVQDACNLAGILRSWVKALDAVWAESHGQMRGSNWVHQHPINVMFACKVSDLTGGSFDYPMIVIASDACEAIVKGEAWADALVQEVAHA